MYSGQKIATFRERLCEIIDESGKNDIDIAHGINVSKQTISAWRNDKRSPKELTISAIASYFSVNVKWLMGFDVPKYLTESASTSENNTPAARSESDPSEPKEVYVIARGMKTMSDADRQRLLLLAQTAFPNVFDDDEP